MCVMSCQLRLDAGSIRPVGCSPYSHTALTLVSSLHVSVPCCLAVYLLSFLFLSKHLRSKLFECCHFAICGMCILQSC